jgi:hypothetical protein
MADLLAPDGAGNLAEFRARARGLYPRGQHALQAANVDAALNGLGTLNATRDAEYFGAYVGGLLGAVCDANYLEKLDAAVDRQADLHPVIRRGLLDSRFETRRCLEMAATQADAG